MRPFFKLLQSCDYTSACTAKPRDRTACFNTHNAVIAYPYHIFKVKAFAFSHKVKNGGYPLSPMEKCGGVSLWVTAYLHDFQPFCASATLTFDAAVDFPIPPFP